MPAQAMYVRNKTLSFVKPIGKCHFRRNAKRGCFHADSCRTRGWSAKPLLKTESLIMIGSTLARVDHAAPLPPACGHTSLINTSIRQDLSQNNRMHTDFEEHEFWELSHILFHLSSSKSKTEPLQVYYYHLHHTPRQKKTAPCYTRDHASY